MRWAAGGLVLAAAAAGGAGWLVDARAARWDLAEMTEPGSAGRAWVVVPVMRVARLPDEPVPAAPPHRRADEEEALRRFLDRARRVYGAPETVPAVPAPAPAASPAPAPAAANPPPAPADHDGGIPDGEVLLLALRLQGMVLADGVAGIKRGDDVLLALGEFAAAVDFPIDVDGRAGTAAGWFVREDRPFRLDLAAEEAVAGGRRFLVPRDAVVRDDVDVFVPTRMLRTWFGIAFTPDLRDLAVTLDPAEPLPVQERLARQQRLSRTDLARAAGPPLPRHAAGYEPLTWPAIDATAGPRWSRDADGVARTGVRYGVVGTGDLLYGNASVHAAGDTSVRDGAWLDTARVTLRRFDPDGRLPAGATLMEAGEVPTATLPVIGGGRYERGARITNRPLGFTATYDTTDFVGDAPADWDAELYRNGTLIASRRVGPDGRYRFENVDVFLGRNDFRIVLLGPQGQRREEVRSIPIGLGLAAPGQLIYDVTLSQKDQPFYDRRLVETPTTGTLRAAAGLSYGVSENLSLNAGITTVDPGRGRVTYAVGGVAAQAYGVLGAFNGVVDGSGGWALDGTVQTDLLGHAVRVTQRVLGDLADHTGGSGRQYRIGLSLHRDLLLDGSVRLGYALSGDRLWGPGATPATALGARLGIGAGVSALSVSGLVERRETAAGDETRVSGTATAYSGLGGVRVIARAGLDGHIGVGGRGAADGRDPPRLTAAEIAVSAPLASGVWGEVSAARYARTDTNTAGARLSWDLGRAAIGPRVLVGSDGRVEALVELTTAIRREPRYGGMMFASSSLPDSGGVSVRVFEDLPGGAPGGRPVEGAMVMARQTGAIATTDARGVAVLGGLPSHVPTDVLIDPGSLGDPYLQPATRGWSVVPRPGVLHPVDIPVIMAGEVEGRILAADAGGIAQPLRGVPVRLVAADGTVAATERTAFDGVYVFTAVPVGSYTVELDADAAARRGVTAAYRRTVTIGPEGGLVALDDATLGGPPVAVAAVPAAATAPGPAVTAAGKPTVVVGSYASRLGAVIDLMHAQRTRPGAFHRVAATAPRVTPDPATGRFAVVMEVDGDAAAAREACDLLRRDDRPCRVQEPAA